MHCNLFCICHISIQMVPRLLNKIKFQFSRPMSLKHVTKILYCQSPSMKSHTVYFKFIRSSFSGKLSNTRINVLNWLKEIEFSTCQSISSDFIGVQAEVNLSIDCA